MRRSNMRKILLPAVILMSLALTACAGQETAADEVSAPSEEPLFVMTSEETVEEEIEAETEVETGDETTEVFSEFTFNPHVFSDREALIVGDGIKESFFNMCDALRKGEDTFECTDEYIYNWCISGRLINYYFPAATDYIEHDIESDLCGFENGVGKIAYLVPKDEFLLKEKEFEDLVVGILKDNLKPEYTDFEKALALYVYVTQNYTYDVESAVEDSSLHEGSVTTYSTFIEGSGICQELSGVYAYLLSQCGITNSVISGSYTESGGHQWNLVTIDGKEYHVDTTAGLCEPDMFDGHTPMDYFLMSDNVRINRDAIDPATIFVHGRDDYKDYFTYSADDDSYKELQGGYLLDIDYDNDVISLMSYDNYEPVEYNYGE